MHAARPYGDKKIFLACIGNLQVPLFEAKSSQKSATVEIPGQEAIKSRRDAWGRASGHERTQHECEEGRRHRGASFSDSFLVKFTEY
jgi:hypothetical protein